MKILVIGNCQARPLAQILTSDGTNTSLDPIILHLAKDIDAEHHLAAMDEADLILAQYTAPTFKPTHLEMRRVKNQFPQKTLAWPNIFYAGQHPYLRYVTHLDQGRISGPLDVYHDLRLLRDWYVERVGDCPFAIPASQDAVHHHSMKEFMDREAGCDVSIADLIEENHTARPLFFTFNHPTRWLLEQLAAKIAEKAGFRFDASAFTVPEPLGRISPPRGVLNKALEPEKYQGVDVDHDGSGPVSLVEYDWCALRAAQFHCYDRQETTLRDHARIRMTPNFP